MCPHFCTRGWEKGTAQQRNSGLTWICGSCCSVLCRSLLAPGTVAQTSGEYTVLQCFRVIGSFVCLMSRELFLPGEGAAQGRDILGSHLLVFVVGCGNLDARYPILIPPALCPGNTGGQANPLGFSRALYSHPPNKKI